MAAMTTALSAVIQQQGLNFSAAFSQCVLEHRGTIEKILHVSLESDEVSLDDLPEEVQVDFMSFIEELLLAVNPPQPLM